MKKLLNNNYFKTFIFSLLLGALIIVPSLIANGGILIVGDDLNHQQIPFNMVMNDFLKLGNIFWNSINDLGADFVGSFSFYNLGSPFVLLGFLFPANYFPYLIGPIMILKYAVAGLLSFIFLKRYVKNPKYAILGSLLYAFSGFQITNTLFNHFHDVVALFPLLLIALDKIMYDNKKGWMIFAVAINALTNYFFFIGQVVFVIIYFLFKIITKEYKFTLKKFLQIIIEAVLGVGISAILLVPSILFVLTNPRVGGEWTLTTALTYSIGKYADIFRAFILSPELMQARSTIVPYNYRSVELFLPLIGSVVLFSNLYKNPKRWYSILGICAIVMMFIPILNSTFYVFNDFYYARWFYMPLLIFSLISIKGLEERIPIKKGVITTLIIFVILLGGGLIFKFTGEKFVYDWFYFILTLTLFIGCLIYLLLIYKVKDNNKFQNYLFIGVVAYIIILGNSYFYQCTKKFTDKFYTPLEYKEKFLNAKDYINLDLKDYERADATLSCSYNLGLITRYPIVKTFNSNISGNSFKFYYSTKFYRHVETDFYNDDYALRNFLGIKYILSCDEKEKSYFEGIYTLVEQNEYYTIYENPGFLPLGIIYDYYIEETDYLKYKSTERKNILQYAIVLSEEQVEKYGNLLEELPENFQELETPEFSKKQQTNSNLKFSENIITDKINSEREQLILYSIPNELGWSLKINGEEHTIETSSNGFMIFKLETGENNIELIYSPKERFLGIIITAVSLMGTAVYLIVPKRRSK